MRVTALLALLAASTARIITKPVTLNSREKLLAGGSARFTGSIYEIYLAAQAHSAEWVANESAKKP